jgi:hypothetical protein
LSEGSHTFTVKVTDAANNNSTDTHTWTIDTTAPTVTIDSGPSDPTNDASASFTFTTGGDPVGVECQLDGGVFETCDTTSTHFYAGPISQGSHTFTVRVTDAADNSNTDTYNWDIDLLPVVSSITRVDGNPTNATSVNFTVTFSEAVTGVDTTAPFADFLLTPTGVIDAEISAVSGSDDVYTVTVNTGSGNGTIRLDVVDDDSIVDGTSNPLGGTTAGNGDFTTGEVYDVNKTLTLKTKSNPAADGWILESSETSNQGGTLDNTAILLYVGDNMQDRQYRSLLSFNTAGLPDNAVITSVQLKIRVQGYLGDNMFVPAKTHGNLLMDISQPYFGTSGGLVLNDFQSAANQNGVGVLSSVPVAGWYTVNLKSAAYPFVNATGTTQFRLRFQTDDNDDGSNDYLRVFSGDAAANQRPQLIIEYYVP